MKNRFIILAAMALLAHAAVAEELRVFAARDFQPALKEITQLFVQQTGFEVGTSSGNSTALAEKIIRGAKADLFFPATESDMQLVVEKGLVDVALKRNVLRLPAAEPAGEEPAPEPEYAAAAVLLQATNRLQAMAFLEFLVSEPARAVFARHGFALP
ncbi:MAG: substrate-binding domain-containing protein [Kiritimatiellia bacterium]